MSNRTFRIAEVGLRANDLDKMSTFYQEMLGFSVALVEPHVVFLKVGELDSPLGSVGHPQLLALFKRDAEVNTAVSTFDHIAFELPSDQYDEELAKFKGLDMVIRERAWPDSLPWNGRSFFFRDPEGNVVEVITANR